MKRFLSVLFIFLFCGLMAEDISIESPTTFYSGRENSVSVKTENLSGGSLSWSIRYAGAPAASGEQEIPSDGVAKIKFTFPATKPGVIADAEFICSAANQKSQKAIFFYPPNPFAEKKKILEELQIEVWHPDADKSLTELLKSCEAPFSEISNFSECKGKVLIIAGIDFSNFQGFADTISKLLQAERKIIIINPVSGKFFLKTAELSEIQLAKNGKIKEFSKKFDDADWGGKAPAQKSLKLASSDGAPALEIANGQKDFTYCRLASGKGSLAICSWDIAGLSKDSPTPLYILDKLIDDNNKK